MSQHVVLGDSGKWVFGWDNPLQSFYLQVHDLTRPEDDRLVIWLGDAKSMMYEVEDLVREARRTGLKINEETQRVLYADKDEGR